MVLLAGCAGAPAQDLAQEVEPEVAQGAAGETTAQALDEPPEIFIGPKGTRFRLLGRAQTRVVGAEANPQRQAERLRERSVEAEHDPTAPPTLEELAEALRPVTLINGWEYLAEEPAYELAEAILNGDDWLTQSTEGREARELKGPDCQGGPAGFPCDDRTEAFSTEHEFNSPNMFVEHGCSATMIDRGTAVTAAHCLYNTFDNYWYVIDGEQCASSSERSYVSTEDRRSGTNTQNCLPRFAAGMNSSGAPYGWQGCYNVTVPSWWRWSSDFTDGRIYDYAVVDFHVAGCGYANPGDTSGWRGTMVPDADDFANNYSWIVGYPGVANPGGAVQNPFAHIQYGPDWCGTLSDGLSGTADDSYSGCDTAALIGMSLFAGYYIDPTFSGNEWQIGTSLIDVTGGQSGAGVFLTAVDPGGFGTTAPSSTGAYYLVGIHSGSDPSGGLSLARKWDSTVSGFVVSNSDFPRL